MTREEIFEACLKKIGVSKCLLLEAATGTGKSKVSIDLTNQLCSTIYKGKPVKVLLLVYRRIHKITWRNEIAKWKGLHVDVLDVQCYASMHKFFGKQYDIIIADEVHHIGSELKLEQLKNIKFSYFIGLSATIPRKTKQYFKYKYHMESVVCDIVEAIEDGILPEPEIVLFPLKLDNSQPTESWEINPKAKGPTMHGEYKDLWKYKKQKVHAILRCTQRQKSMEYSNSIVYWKNQFNRTRNEIQKQIWLHLCGQRLEYYADIKIPVVKKILEHLKKSRTITFCKTIPQAEAVGKWCIHSKNGHADEYYEAFNARKINHITAVNILNENANLVDCKYAIFDNLSSSEVVVPQRLGRAMRHPEPVIVIPYYEGTREQELVEKLTEGFNKDFIRVVKSIEEI